MRISLPLILFVTSCQAAVEPLALRCDIVLSSISPDEALPGVAVTATGRPMTTTWDTAIYVADVRAPLLRMSRDQCDECDSCRSQMGCTACQQCDECADTCRDTCVETVTFAMPSLPEGSAEVSMYNRHGQTNALAIYALPTLDTGRMDSGAMDTGPPAETGTPSDSGATDDSGTSDSGIDTAVDTSSP